MLVVGLARPVTTIKTPRREATVVLAVDVSNSMAATDIKPTRLAAAKAAADAFVARQSSGVKIGVVSFGNGAIIVQTPTTAHADVSRPSTASRSAGARRWGRDCSRRSTPSPASS